MNGKHIHHFFSLNAAHDMMPFFTRNRKSAAKEITESLGCLEAAKTLPIDLNDAVIICPGDGKIPRTSSVFAFLSKGSVHSIDPIMDIPWFTRTLYEKFKVKPQRLSVYKRTAEQMKGVIDCHGRNVVIVGCHSHAPHRGNARHSKELQSAKPCISSLLQ